MQSYNISQNINKKITSTDASDIVTIIDSTAEVKPNIVAINTFVDSLKVYAFIGSLAPVKLPNFKLEDTENEKLYKTLDIEFNSPRKQLDVLISNNGGNWNPIGNVSLLNPIGYPYRIHNLLDFFINGFNARLGNNFKIGVQVKDVGFGVLSGNDVITVHGSYTQEHVINVPTTPINLELEKVEDFNTGFLEIDYETSKQLLLTNNNRKYVLIENDAIYLNSSPAVISFVGNSCNSEIIIQPGGNFSFSINELPYTGIVYAKTLSENKIAKLKYVEAF